MKLYKGRVLRGEQLGRTIGFPTLNLDPLIIPQNTKLGVYASNINIKGESYLGALYFGPRLIKGESNNVLEIYVFEFDKEVYGVEVLFTIGYFIRPAQNFDSVDELKVQIQKDVDEIKSRGTL